MQSRRVIAAALALHTVSCASIGLSEPQHGDEVLRSERRQVDEDDVVVDVDQDETSVIIGVHHRCRIGTFDTIRRTTTREHVNLEPARDWVFGGLGVAGAASGAWLIADAQLHVYDNDEGSRRFNPFGPTIATAIGAGLVGLGTAFATIAIVDVARASGADEVVSMTEVERSPSGQPTRCKGSAVQHPLLAGRVESPSSGKRTLELGGADEQGVLEVDLDALPLDATEAWSPQMVVQFRRADVATVDLRPLFALWEQRAWAALDTRACLHPNSARACAAHEAFLIRFPHGRLAPRVQRTLSEAAPRLAALKDQAAWEKSDHNRCSKARGLRSNEAIDDACRAVIAYREDFPVGRHAAQASQLLAAAKAQKDKLAADEAARRARRDELEAAQRKRDEAAGRRACHAECQMECSRRFRNAAMCMRGCVVSRCG